MNIHIIIGSTRPGRVGPQIAQWMYENLSLGSNHHYEIIDIEDYGLPMFNEPIHPSLHQYQFDYTKRWSHKIEQADGYIFLTPEYNAGYPSSLKNAIDYLYQEWLHKPAMIVSYGTKGGTSASSQLRQVLERLKMKVTMTSPAFNVNNDMSDENGQIKDIALTFQQYHTTIKEAESELVNYNNDIA
ncbi:MAG: hypothetical protein NVSMB46_01660 [Candidatus Saccharimonadales bacterium]